MSRLSASEMLSFWKDLMETLTDGQRVGVLEGHREAGLRLRKKLVEIRKRTWKQPEKWSETCPTELVWLK